MQKYPCQITRTGTNMGKLSAVQLREESKSKSQSKSSCGNNYEIKKDNGYMGKYCKLIQQMPLQQNTVYNAFANNRNQKNRSLSYDEIGVGQCKIFQSKVRMKRNNSRNQKQKACSCHNQSEHACKQEQQRKESISFAEQYRINLRKTVFNETKMMIKYKKRKQKQQLIQTLSHYKPNQTIITQDYPPKVVPAKSSLHNFRSRHMSQKISTNLDSIYKCTLDSSSNNNQGLKHIRRVNKEIPSCCELDIAKFPIIMKGRDGRVQDENANYSNLLNALNMRQTLLKQSQNAEKQTPKKRFSKNGFNRASSRGSNFQKHQIKPWETYADQFVD